MKLIIRFLSPYFLIYDAAACSNSLDLRRKRELSDFGGDVSQYMSLLKGTSAFNFKPGSGAGEEEPENILPDRLEDDEDDVNEEEAFEDERRRRRSSEAASPGEDFGGDYGDYLKLLQGDSALGYNPQPDPISDKQVG